MIRNGPNGTYERRPIRRAASRTTRTTPASSNPLSTPPRDAREAEHEAGPREQLDVAHAERARPERDRRQVQEGRDDDRGEQGPDPSAPDERVEAADGVHQRDRDDRQRQDIGEQPLVEVGRQADDERDEPRPEERERKRIAGKPRRQERERDRGGGDHDHGPPAERPARRVLGVLGIVLRPADGETIGRETEERAGDPGEDRDDRRVRFHAAPD